MATRFYPPGPGIIRSMAHEPLTFPIAFGELIDNALDAGATRVVFTVGAQHRGTIESLRVEDDGEGCGDLAIMVALATGERHQSTVLGRYGIGAKNAMVWLGGEDSKVEIASTHAGTYRHLTIRWPDFAREWGIEDEWRKDLAALPGQVGTMITVWPCIQRVPEGLALDRLCAELGYLYAPALRRGVQIKLVVCRRGVPPRLLQAWELPPFESDPGAQIDAVASGHGRSVRVHAGIVRLGAKNPKPGLTYTHGFRVIRRHGGLGCGGLDFANIAGIVELDAGWHLTKNKDDVSRHLDELAASVFGIVKPLLERAAQRASELKLSTLTGAVEARLNAMIGPPTRKGRRQRTGDEPGTVEPKDTPRRQRRASREQDGKTFPRPPAGGLHVSYQDLDDPEALGHYSEGRVVLNKGHAFVQGLHAANNADGLAVIALNVFIRGATLEQRGGQRWFSFAHDGDVVTTLGKLLAQPAELDGRPLAVVSKSA